jgi:putative radical SAM enzyme (TIGR03279 family)
MSPIRSPLSDRRVDLAPETPGLISAVASGSLADELDLRPGDRIVSVDDRPVMDALDFQFNVQAERAVFEVERNGGFVRHELELEGDEFWGITFGDPTFDGVRICENACPFCFIKQIPKGMRKSLYVMDDDFRYSMLYGSFVTLTNLTEEDWQRIEDQHLGPMHVSVHATNPELRVALVGNPKGANIMRDLVRLERAGIDFHAQLVLCPGVNDGEEMDRSLRDLSSFGPRLLSIAGVPVGLTKYGLERQSKQLRLSRTCMRLLPGKQIEVRRHDPEEALEVIKQAEAWQAKFRKERGTTFFYLGDEFYLMTGQSVPPPDLYDGYPQIEDGIGITRHFLENLASYLRRTPRGSLAGGRGKIACGTLIAPTMREAVDGFNTHTGANLEVVIVENTFFGSEINISGLLTGGDVARAFESDSGSEPVYISNRMVSDRTNTMLDDLRVPDLSGQLGRPVVACGLMSDVARDLRQRLRVRKAA